MEQAKEHHPISFNPVIVLGPPRSGTSAVARVLHENLGISMGIEFKPPDPATPDGHYEEAEVNYWNNEFLKGKILFTDWWNAMLAYSTKRMEQHIPWGFKDPKCSVACILGGLIALYSAPMFVRCHRRKEQVIESNVRVFHMEDEEASNMYDSLENFLDRCLTGRKAIFMDMSERLTDEQIMSGVGSGLIEVNQ